MNEAAEKVFPTKGYEEIVSPYMKQMRDMSKDDCWNWVIPAITLGFTVKNDPDGKLILWNEYVKIYSRRGVWVVSDGVDPDRQYHNLRAALEAEA